MRPRFFHRGIIPLLTLFFSASGSQKTAVTPLENSGRCHSACRPLRGDQFPDDPRWLSGQAGAFCSLTALSRRNHAPRQTHPASWERQRTAPRRGAALRCGRNLRFPHKRPLPEMRRWGLVIGSVCAAAFFHRGIIPLLTPFFSASGSQKQLSPPAGGSVPWRPSLITRASGSFLPPHSPTHRAQVRSEFLPQGHTAPRHSHPASWERQRSAPR